MMEDQRGVISKGGKEGGPVLPEIFFKISGILLKSIGNFGRPFLLHFYVTIFGKNLKKKWNFFERKIQKTFALERSQISAIFVHFRANFGRFRALFGPNEISGVFGQNIVPDASKISVGVLNQISGEIRNFGQYGNTGFLSNKQNWDCLFTFWGKVARILILLRKM